MGIVNRINDWLETRWVAPAYAGWVLAAVSVSFLAAAINTMVGWLYVMSGVIFALLGCAAVLPVRSLRHLSIRRSPIHPVTAGDQLSIEIEILNQTNQPKTLLQVQDVIPYVLGKPVQTAVETIPPHDFYHWIYYQPTTRRGVYRWHTVQLRTATPLGLFWCRRTQKVPTSAFVYPTVLPLKTCPLIDDIGREEKNLYYSRDRRASSATEGITRALRPYRTGDPIRLIHWRTSARYGDLKVRELEVITGGQDVIISLDSSGTWHPEDFEQAVIAAASLYFYASRSQLNVKLWTAGTGLLWGNQVVLETLAAVVAGEDATGDAPPPLPLIWLTQNPVTLSELPSGSRWVLWQPKSSTEQASPVNHKFPGIAIDTEKALQSQLQQQLQRT